MVVRLWNLLTCIVIVGVVSPPAAVSVVCAADTVMAVGLITWLERVAMVPKVVIGVAREALVLWAPAPARLVETVPVTVPRVVTPNGRKKQRYYYHFLSSSMSLERAREWELYHVTTKDRRLCREHLSSPPPPSQTRGYVNRKTGGRAQSLPRTWPMDHTPVVPFTTNVVTAGLTAETVTGVTRRTPPMGTVRRIVPGCPGAPFSTTWNIRAKCHQCHFQADGTMLPLSGLLDGHMWSALD